MISRSIFVYISLALILGASEAFRVLQPGQETPTDPYFRPNDRGFVGIYGDPTNFQRERINEGALETATQELIYEDNSPRQACPNMVGPFSDGNFYCTAREFGYCDRRSGTCFCNTGYQGIDCLQCTDAYFKLGSLCYPKRLCPNDCNGAGECNYFNGTCSCFPHRTGIECENLLCSIHSDLCETCTENECLKCAGGFYLSLDDAVCSSCFDFDPRCAGCTKERGCTDCADSTLTSVRRSGYRNSDPQLPVEEERREFSITLPFGTKSPESFADAENYVVVTTPANALRNKSISCTQGLSDDESWDCSPFTQSHIVCGHFGVFSFSYPNYVIPEKSRSIRMSVQRTGGGHGEVFINYYIRHLTTNDSDLIATAPYTTSQRLQFEDGMVQKSFLITILDDNIVEEDEVFQVVLEVPEGGGSVGAQFRANVTIVDDDAQQFSPKLSKLLENTTSAVAGEAFTVHVSAVAANGLPMKVGGERFFALLENHLNQWSAVTPGASASAIYAINPSTAAAAGGGGGGNGGGMSSARAGRSWQQRGQRHSLRQAAESVTDFGNGTYQISFRGVPEQGEYQLRVWHAFPDAIRGDYFYDGFFERLGVSRLDHQVNFTWGSGKLLPRGSDYISVRWSGAVYVSEAGSYQFKVEADDHARLWINGDLLLDHFHQQAVNLEPSRSVVLAGDTLHEVVLEYREVQGEARARLLWSNAGVGSPMVVIPQDNLFSLFEVDRSPVMVTVVSAATDARTTECTGEGLYSGTARKLSEFSFCPRDRFRNLRDDVDTFFLSSEIFEANVTLVDDLGHGGEGPEVIHPSISYNTRTHCFDAWYIPQRAGQYKLAVSYRTWWDEPAQQVAGSPFYLQVLPDRTSGPKSDLFSLPVPLYAEAGRCYNFTVVARDNARNLRLVGGDRLQVYTFRVDYYSQFSGDPISFSTPDSPTASPSAQPTFSVTSAPTLMPTGSPLGTSGIPGFAELDVVRFGTVTDLENGNYSLQICPVIAGVHEIHVLLNGAGISNQPIRLLDPLHSAKEPLGEGSYRGQYVAEGKTPSPLIVSHTEASIVTSTAAGPGLVSATVGIPAYFVVTVRDPWDNVLRDDFRPAIVTAQLDKSPPGSANPATVAVWNYRNGSFFVEYVPKKSGENIISVFVNGHQIRASPFLVPTVDGSSSATNAVVVGPGLHSGSTGVTSYFEVFAYDIDNNRKNNNDDVFYFTVEGSRNSITGFTQPCPLPPIPNHPICDPTDDLAGHYFGQFTPTFSGQITVRVYLQVIVPNPTASPTSAPTADPTIAPTNASTAEPSVAPTDAAVSRSRARTLLGEDKDGYGVGDHGAMDAEQISAVRDWDSGGAERRLQTTTTATVDGVTLLLVELSATNFGAVISSSSSSAASSASDISGTLYDNVAGVEASVHLQLRDNFGNKLLVGGAALELAVLGVAGDWGTPLPHYPLQGRANEYYYKGFYAEYPTVYGTVADHLDGSYTMFYNVNTTGVYVLRVALAQSGLNATYFNDTNYGHLTDHDFGKGSGFDAAQEGIPSNLGSTISWTGDIGKPFDPRGGRMQGNSYYGRYLSKTEANIDFDLSDENVNQFVNGAISVDGDAATNSGSLIDSRRVAAAGTNETKFKFRDEFWSARWTGMITPEHAELYTFTLEANTGSEVRLWIGGRGAEFNGSEPGELILAVPRPSQSEEAVRVAGRASPGFPVTGRYNFTDAKSREFVLEYAHLATGEDAKLRLFWASPSSPQHSIVPESAFTHWQNISHYNLTIHPAPLCSPCSTAVGDALHSAQVNVAKSFTVYGRDRFGNLLQQPLQDGIDVPLDSDSSIDVTMVAVGKDGVSFRGRVTDYGNSTYLIDYLPSQAGVFRMYVTIGCCVPTGSVGYPYEAQKIAPLLINGGQPFLLTVEPAPVDPARTFATGGGLVGGVVGDLYAFTVYYRDIFHNPTSQAISDGILVTATLFDSVSGSVVQPDTITYDYSGLENVTIVYNLTRAGQYLLDVKLQFNASNPSNITIGEHIVDSPFSVLMTPTYADPALTVCRGNGLRVAATNRTASFEIQLYDVYNNNIDIGGDKFYVRVLGDALFQRASIPITPRCVDTSHGRYVCTYQPLNSGDHQIVIRLLNSSRTVPGGNGLLGRYYSSESATYGLLAPAASSPSSSSSRAAAAAARDGLGAVERPEPSYVVTDPTLSFSWPEGRIAPSEQVLRAGLRAIVGGSAQEGSAAGEVNAPLPLLPIYSAGQSARWEGYLLTPRTDIYTISARGVTNCEVEIYLDSVLVFDSRQGSDVQTTVDLLADQVSYITVQVQTSARVVSEELGEDVDVLPPQAEPVRFEVVWSTYSMREHTIPRFYLYDNANEIALSPFPISVS